MISAALADRRRGLGFSVTEDEFHLPRADPQTQTRQQITWPKKADGSNHLLSFTAAATALSTS
jgi:hypothetical protein